MKYVGIRKENNLYKILESNLKNWCLSHNGEETRVKLQKIADVGQYTRRKFVNTAVLF